MLKSNRCIALLLVLVLLCGMISAAQADVVTLGIYFCGRKVSADGTENIVRLDGTFRVLQNGEEAGTIEAGKETLTLTDTERIRIVPLAETIDPEWDLSNAACDVTPEAGSTYTVPVIVELPRLLPRQKRIQTSFRFRKMRTTMIRKSRKIMTMKRTTKRISMRNPHRSTTVL